MNALHSFYIYSKNSKQFFWRDWLGKLEWCTDINKAMKFECPLEAYEFIQHWCTDTSKAIIILYDGAEYWDISKSKILK